MALVDEELQAHQEELERQKQEERERRKREAKGTRTQRAIRLARQIAERDVKGIVKKRATAVVLRAIGAAVAEFLAAAAPVILVILAIIGVVLLVVVVIVVACNAEGVTGVAARTASAIVGILGPDICESFAGLSGPVSSALNTASSLLCSLPEELARQNNVPYPRQNDPDLDRFIGCVQGRVPDVGSVFTFDVTHTICNFNRGGATAETCDICSHSVNSCHYGGGAGSTGSLAVDFGNESQGSQILQASQACNASLGFPPLKRATCEDKDANPVLCSSAGATHVHISLGKCDRDNGPVNTQ